MAIVYILDDAQSPQKVLEKQGQFICCVRSKEEYEKRDEFPLVFKSS